MVGRAAYPSAVAYIAALSLWLSSSTVSAVVTAHMMARPDAFIGNEEGCVVCACSVSSVFIWSMASWDVLGVYPESTTQEGSYRDPDVVAALSGYNKAVRDARDAAGQQEEEQRDAVAGTPAAAGTAQPEVVVPAGPQLTPAQRAVVVTAVPGVLVAVPAFG
jgi:hypothetical protein